MSDLTPDSDLVDRSLAESWLTPRTATCATCEDCGVLWPLPGTGRFICDTCSLKAANRWCARATNARRDQEGLPPILSWTNADLGQAGIPGLLQVLALPNVLRPEGERT